MDAVRRFCSCSKTFKRSPKFVEKFMFSRGRDDYNQVTLLLMNERNLQAMMNAIDWTAKGYVLNGKPEILVSGEFHYFRVPRNDWKERLEWFLEAGGNCVATYIPWILHEPTEGDVRFGDTPERDLEAFLTLCRDMGIYVIARPGPYQYSEMKYCGLPGWLCENYPELLARDIKGKVMVKDSVSYLHPAFLERVKKWFDVVCPLIARHTVNRGGPVAFVQFDNELTGIHEWFGGWDYHPETMGFGREDGRYARFLKARYDGIHALNVAYETGFGGFMDVRPIDAASIRSIGDRRRTKDYQDFYFLTIAEYAVQLTDWMREAGIDCDFIHNSANPGSNAFHYETAVALGSRFILGSDHYYNLDMDWNANNPTPKYAVSAFLSNESLRHMGFPPTVYELPGGSPSDWPPITPEDLKCCYMTNIAFGMKGFNYYVFTGGYNPENIGGDGDVYDYQAAIAPDHKIRPHYYTQKEFGRFLRDHSWLAEADQIGDYYMGLDREHTRSKYYAADYPGFSSSDAWTFLNKGMAITSLCASYSPEMIDLYNDRLIEKTDKPLLVASSDNMAASIQKRLVDFVLNGGRLLLSPVIPRLDDQFDPCTILMDFLEGASVKRFTETGPEVHVGPVGHVYVNGGLWECKSQPSGASTIAHETRTGATVAWAKDYPNGAKVIWLGIQWKFGKYKHMQMLKHLLEELRCESPVVQCDSPNVWTSLRSDGNKRMLFIMNLFSSPMKANIQVRMADGSYTDPMPYALNPMEVRTVVIEE